MSARAAATGRSHLRLVRPTEYSTGRARDRAATSTRRTVFVLLGSAGFLTAGGLIMVLSASSVSAFAQYGSSFVFFQRQAAYAAVGAVVLLVTSRMRYPAWQRLSVPMLAGTCLLLAMVLNPHVGQEVAGSSRWIDFGPVTVQPSELAKLTLVAFAATVMAKKWHHLDEVWHLVLPLFPVVLVVCGMVYLQPDLGTTIVLAGSVALLLFAAGVRLRYLLPSVALAAASAAALVASSPYQLARFRAWLHPWEDPQGRGWQLIQSLFALGSGGWTGVGLGASRQKWMYVPNAHTDFIFSILGEELGLIGEIVVLVVFGALIFAGIRVAARAPDTFGRMLAAGIVSWFGLQTIVNLGAVTGLLPITGVPLPFLSFGGSSLVVSLAAVGILVSIARASAPRDNDRAARARSRRTAA